MLRKVSIAAVILAVGLSGCESRRETTFQLETCQRTLKAIEDMLLMYTDAHEGIPTSIERVGIIEGLPPDSRIWRCPGVKRRDVARMDYVYVNWSTWFTNINDVPGEYPVLYDGSLSNHYHYGLGINVVDRDGYARWDADARWLTTFASNNPSYHIVIPK
jgi:hypothetical protein